METQVRRTKIIATLGPATDAPGMLKKILAEGVDVVRLNMSHGKPEDHARRAREVREVAAELGREVAVLADLQGPKIRVEKFLAGPVILKSGDPFELDCRTEAPPGDATRIGVSYLGLRNDVKAGDMLLLDDGLISLKVEKIVGTSIHTTVVAGGALSDRKGINRQGGGLSLSALAEKDKNDIKTAAQINADFLAISFVKSAADIEESRKLMRAAGGSAAMVAKIERSEAIGPALAGIIDASDVVMVARGDLGVEIGDAELPGIQKKIIRETLARSKVVITATQMMQSMVESPIPTRAEVLDVANAVLDGTDAVMLSQETAAGKHPDKAVAAMARVCVGAERGFDEGTDEFRAPAVRLDRVDQAIALATMYTARHIGVRAIIALTESGGTAQWLSRYRSRVPIYALSRRVGARRRMMIYRDVTPIAFDAHGVDPAHAAKAAIQTLFNLNHLSEGDRVILTTGDHTGQHGGTNTMKLLRVGPGGVAEGLGDL
ncbi:MAG: pyruvate kinase [Proteobacteria bacterium]|uniref:pyruvate kinase n=1 Tax=Rudaea sp. TaxID=2136325 RepID=UPI001DA5A1E7|nr:pyruvate kinase [Pseudomonadota bacterium]MBS0567998.1 pyruvate kinase [Pseudomonadota bacterium]